MVALNVLKTALLKVHAKLKMRQRDRREKKLSSEVHILLSVFKYKNLQGIYSSHIRFYLQAEVEMEFYLTACTVVNVFHAIRQG